VIGFAVGLAALAGAAAIAAEPGPEDVREVFEPAHANALVMRVEAAIALSQAEFGEIPQAAADEIAAKAGVENAPLDAVAEEYALVRHRMVALLNVWRRGLSEEASDALHKGVTTVDVYDTVALLQVLATIDILIADMRALEARLVALATEHRDTAMIGRTLGQHALPITFGKKVAVWAAANRRNIERLEDVRGRLERLGVLRGAVGSHLGLGENGLEIERAVSRRLGLAEPDPADWHGARDVFAEYALALALAAKTYAAIGDEIFRLQMTDIGEVYERRASTAVGSSSMPHKFNPSLSEALVHHGRVVPRLAEVLLDDVVNYFERDNTSRPNEALEDISVEAADMVLDATRLIERLVVREEAMAANLSKTGGLVFSQRIVLAAADQLGKEAAEAAVRDAARRVVEEGVSFREALLADDRLKAAVGDDLGRLLDVEGYLGLAGEQVDRTVAALSAAD